MFYTIKNKVRDYLERLPELRENKLKLTRAIWEDECSMYHINTMEGFMDALLAGKLSHPETLRRTAMVVANENPHLKPSVEVQLKNKEMELKMRGGKGDPC